MFRKVLKCSLIIPIISVILFILYFLNLYNEKFIKRSHKTEELNQVTEESSIVNNDVHAFYYAWYGNPLIDQGYVHWNHRFLPHWTDKVSKKYSTGKRHDPPEDIGSNFYPSLGLYSSNDPIIQKIHMNMLKKAKIGVIAVSWYPPGKSDDEGLPATEEFWRELLDSAEYSDIKVCFHIEPYKGRTAKSVGEDIKYLIKTFGNHGAIYKREQVNAKLGDWSLPLFYIYDSYKIDSKDWKEVLARDGRESSIRNSQDTDAFVIGLLVNRDDMQTFVDSNFDGFYTYFASHKMGFAAASQNWNILSKFAIDNNLLFIPSVGPGYIDTNIRPWNDDKTVARDEGKYYRKSWDAAIQCQADIVSITSFNEWHEGTQIEPAVPKSVFSKHPFGSFTEGQMTYLSYDYSPEYYLELTRSLVKKFERSKTSL